MRVAAFCVLALSAIFAQSVERRDLPQILAEIRTSRAQLIKPDRSDENKSKLRLNRALDRLEKQVVHIFSNRVKLKNADFAVLWAKMNSVEGQSLAMPELIMQILEMPFGDLLKRAEQIGLLVEVPASSSGCCAIEGYYRINPEKISRVADDIVLAFRVRMRDLGDRAARGLNHGIMIELVDRGYYDSYNGYSCIHNKSSRCHIVAD